ncbi:reverse transcriptase/maturase family protein [Lentibacillus sp. N15]|uniref:reverse transcriptase/maturase family protein n=1 Tax=Lentibacillus songyuanensis TaxID=3136161 RepID=UPI0031BAED37
MKRVGQLFEKIIDYENLFEAYLMAKKGKRYRGEVLDFSYNAEEELIQIQNDLIYGTYEVGRYREFYVYHPKKRLIMALPFRDRVVQWAIYKVLYPIYFKRFIKDSYACINGRGSHSAAARIQYWLRQLERQPGKTYYLQMDMSKYFYRINHDILLSIISRTIKDKDLMVLLARIIKSEHTKFGIPLGDHFYEQERVDGVGMPIGNLTSQLFANVYLNEMDQYAKHDMKVRHYIRYMDDIVILHKDKNELKEILIESNLFLQHELHLQINNKTRIDNTNHGVDFVGKRIWPTHMKLRKETVKNMKSRLKYIQKQFAFGEVSTDEVRSVLSSYLGLMKHTDSHNLRKKILKEFVLTRGAE